MKYAIEVNGNRLHDEGENDARGVATRPGGGAMTFATEAQATAAADALHARDLAFAHARGRGKRFPKREAYKVVPVSA